MDEDATAGARPDQPAEALAARSDGTLLKLVHDGANAAAAELYLRYARRLKGLVRGRISDALSARVEADDIVQSVFRTFFRHAGRGDYEVPPGDDLWKLLLAIALNKLRSQCTFHGAGKRDVARSTVLEADDAAADDEAAAADLRITLEELAAPLDDDARAAVRLRLAGHEVAAIAERIGRSKRSVERVLQDFRRRLANALGMDDAP